MTLSTTPNAALMSFCRLGRAVRSHAGVSLLTVRLTPSTMVTPLPGRLTAVSWSVAV